MAPVVQGPFYSWVRTADTCSSLVLLTAELVLLSRRRGQLFTGLFLVGGLAVTDATFPEGSFQ